MKEVSALAKDFQIWHYCFIFKSIGYVDYL